MSKDLTYKGAIDLPNTIMHFSFMAWAGGKEFWVTNGNKIDKLRIDGTTGKVEPVCNVNPVGEGTWALAWAGDPKRFYTLQRTCEEWVDGKTFLIEVLNPKC